MFVDIMNKLSRLSQKKILAMAGVTGTAMFGLIYTTLSSAVADKSIVEQPQVVEVKTPTVAIVTAAVDIPAQTVIQEGMLKLTDIPQDMVTTTTVRDISKLVGKVTRVDVLTDDVFTEKKVFHNIEQAGLTGMIPPDCRAISIGISDVTSVSGFINPGDHVDVMMVYERDGNVHSEIILQNVLLIAMGKRADQTDKGILEGAVSGLASGLTAGVAGAAQAGGGAEKSGSTATLALHADEILQIAAAARKGTLYLVMRPFRPDEEYIADASYSTKAIPTNDAENLYGLPSIDLETKNAQPPTPAFQPPASPVVDRPSPAFQPPAQSGANNTPPPEQGIEIIQGDKVTRS
ncbi:MAG: Flp pilus assembly protein CpaB [Selenomonadaceae bacterium]|nr:Flp pilus assembly protein CpaB [Selenomonadaceae bacterium]